MRTRYQRAFDHVTASGRLREEVLNMTKQEKRSLRRRIPRAVLIAAALALLLAGTALAVNAPGIQAWFQRYWEEAAGEAEVPPAQREVLDDLTQPVGTSAAAEPPEQAEVSNLPETSADAEPSERASEEAPAEPADTAASGGAAPVPDGGDPSAQAGGVTVTLDSVTAGEDQLWMLVRITGRTFETEKDYAFCRGELVGAPRKEYADLGISVGSGVRMSADGCRVLADGSLEMMLWYTNPDPAAADLTDGRAMTLRLTDLMADREPLIRGQWDIPFTLAKTAPSAAVEREQVVLPVEGVDGTDEAVYDMLRVTSTGMELISGIRYEGASLWSDVALVLTDGTEIEGGGAHGTWEGEAHESRWVSSYTWKVPVALEQAAAVRIGDVTVPLT